MLRLLSLFSLQTLVGPAEGEVALMSETRDYVAKGIYYRKY
jgi:hypothetical protein